MTEPSSEPYPLRVRVFGGRAVHAAHEINGGPNRIAACDYFLPAGATNHWLDTGTPITCGRCNHATERSEQ